MSDKEAVPVLELRGIGKRFGAVAALKDVSLQLHAGECHVLLGENGAGKSTLVGVILGFHQPSSGALHIRGEHVERYSPQVARSLGVRAVMQEFSLYESLPVYANLFLGQEEQTVGLRRKRVMRNEARELLAEIDAPFRANDIVANLTRAEQQLVEISKALTRRGDAGVLLLDEPTAALSDGEANRLLTILKRLKAEGWAILYISHRMDELRVIGDRVTVLRDGRHVATHVIDEVSDDQLITEMSGREVDRSPHNKSPISESGTVVLTVEHLATRNRKVEDVSFELRSGEVLGIGGLVGSGKGDLGAALFGITPLAGGRITAAGIPVRSLSSRTMYRLGFGYVAEDRKRGGILPDTDVAMNIMIERIALTRRLARWGLLRRGRMRQSADQLIGRFDVRPSGAAEMPISHLSGGNQQKALIARALSTKRKGLIAVEPTAGVDVGSRMQIYKHLRSECENGVGVLLISSDVDELVSLSDRVLVMSCGTVSAELEGADIHADAIVGASFSSTQGALL
ncbi:sugar ABC transporter ATP-binding protein [Nocardia sp. NPDC047038]|uniref:sugar ABC transporter ATP-binding protein n=1 Tax=Nocardia sp. NPDC047038 TaxID=3154338 RepID=UPI0033C9E3ED